MSRKKNILICPLDWGIGHATRCVPVIRKLLESGQNVVVGADRRPLAFLQQEFPTLKYIKFPGIAINYPSKNNMALKMALSVPSILKAIMQEHQKLNKIVAGNNIDLIISDNRYGAWHRKVPSVFMTHQIHISTGNSGILKALEPVLLAANKFFIHKFDRCWIPDTDAPDNLSGKLSHPLPHDIEADYIGPLSRFCAYDTKNQAEGPSYEIVAIVSGPEPQRSIFEKMIFEQAGRTSKKILLLGGKPGAGFQKRSYGNLHYLAHLDSPQMFHVLSKASLIISRPGYSTIMDLACLQKKAVFVPTPGQTEQEYLGSFHAAKGHCIGQQQHNFDLTSALKETNQIEGFKSLPGSFGPDIPEGFLKALKTML